MTKARYCSTWTALVTPLSKDYSIDFEALEGLLNKQAEVGNGVVLLGSTGEGLALTEQEKMRIVSFACGLKLNLPLAATVGGFNLKGTLEWMSYCEEFPIDAYMMVVPPYSKPGMKGQIEWFKALFDKATKPCMVYNNPSRSACSFLPSVAKELNGHPQFWSIKDSSNSIHDFHAFAEAAPHVDIYSGEDSLMPYLALAGAKGLVSVASNAWPKAVQIYVKKCLECNHNDLLPLWHKASMALFSVSNPIPLKCLLHHKGWISTPFLRQPLSHLELNHLDALIHFDTQISSWEKQALT